MSALTAGVAALAQTGLPFSTVPVGGMGNAPGVTFPTAGTMPVSIVRPHVSRSVNTVLPGTVPIFFGTDEPNTVVINNIVPTPESPSKTSAVQEPQTATPLIIEREGDRWVRRRLAWTAPGQRGPQTETEERMLPAREPQPLRDTTLVFRDGHREYVTTYMIFSGILYHSTPAWAPQQQVKLSQLDISATGKANQRNGVAFRIPNSPNEVVTRP